MSENKNLLSPLGKTLVSSSHSSAAGSWAKLSNEEFSKLEDECIKELEEIIEKNHNELACMIVEPMVQGAAGIKNIFC